MTNAPPKITPVRGIRPVRTSPVTSFALGVPPHVVREIAGHSDIKVTMTVYAHGKLAETIEEMQAIVDVGNRERLY